MKTNKLPFFARYLEGQKVRTGLRAGPGNNGKGWGKGGKVDEPIAVTLKYPSDDDETGAPTTTL